MNNEIEKSINNEYDYSNIIPTAEYIGVLVQYCENAYNSFLELTNKDDSKNEKLKYEYREYEYKKNFSSCFKVIIADKNYSRTEFESYKVYMDAINNNQLNHLTNLKIVLDISFKRGKEGSAKEHNNIHEIVFRPYDIKYKRKSNYVDQISTNIENDLNNLLKKFPYVDTIFCNKNNNDRSE